MTGWAICRCVKPGMTVSAFRSARSMNAARSAARRPDSPSIASRSQSRRSVATWSLRERAVCRRLPASPARAISRFSMLRWTSSKSRDQTNAPRSISPWIVVRPPSMAARSAADNTPTAASIRACASEPAMSAAASRRSKSTEAVNRLTASATGSAKRPDQPCAGAACGFAGCAMDFLEREMRRRRSGKQFTGRRENVGKSPGLPDSRHMPKITVQPRRFQRPWRAKIRHEPCIQSALCARL